MSNKLTTRPRVEANLKWRTLYRMKFSPVLNMPEPEFAGLISEIESDPLIQKLSNPESFGKIISRKRFHNTRLSRSFYELNEQTIAATEGVDVQSILDSHRGMAALIKKIGREKFEKYFVYKEDPAPVETLAQTCGISVKEAKGVQSMLTDLSIHSEFFHASALPATALHYTVTAKLEIDNGRVIVSFLSPHLARGAFRVDYDRLDAVKGSMPIEERKRLVELIGKIEWINLRLNTLQKILNELVVKHEAYLLGYSESPLLPVNQRNVAELIQVAPSTISRAIYAKSVLLPSGMELPLKVLFLSKKKLAQRRIGEYLRDLPEEERKKTPDCRLRGFLLEKHGLQVSRRSVNQYRNELINESMKRDRP